MIKFTGPDFHYIDNRLMALQLVEQGLSDAAVFTADGEVVRPDELLYKKAVLVERGSFRPVTLTTLDILDCAKATFLQQPKVAGEETVVLMEITMQNLAAWGGPSGKIDHTDFLDRVDVLGKLGHTVLISKFGEYYRLGAYLSRCTNKVVAIAMGVPSLIDLFQEKYYTNLEGGILESLGRLFKNDLRLYVYPVLDDKTGELLTVQNLKVAPNLQNLYNHLVENHFIEGLEGYKLEYLHIFSRAVLKLIQSGRPRLGNDGAAGCGRDDQERPALRISIAGRALSFGLGRKAPPSSPAVAAVYDRRRRFAACEGHHVNGIPFPDARLRRSQTAATTGARCALAREPFCPAIRKSRRARRSMPAAAKGYRRRLVSRGTNCRPVR